MTIIVNNLWCACLSKSYWNPCSSLYLSLWVRLMGRFCRHMSKNLCLAKIITTDCAVHTLSRWLYLNDRNKGSKLLECGKSVLKIIFKFNFMLKYFKKEIWFWILPAANQPIKRKDVRCWVSNGKSLVLLGGNGAVVSECRTTFTN